MLIRKLKWEELAGVGWFAYTYIGRFEARIDKWYVWDREGACDHMGDATSIDDAKKSCEIYWCDLIKKHFVEI